MSDDFYIGVLCALAVVASGDGMNSVTYNEIIQACGAADLERVARREKDSQLPGILNYRKANRGR